MAEEIKLPVVISSKKRSKAIFLYIGLLLKIFLVVSSSLFLFWFFSSSIGTLQQVLCNGNFFCMFKVYEVVVRVEWLPLVPVGAVTINIDKFHLGSKCNTHFSGMEGGLHWVTYFDEVLFVSFGNTNVAGLFCMTRKNIQTNIKLIEYGNQHLFELS